MRIVHISDLHARTRWEADQAKLLRAFLRDVTEFHTRAPVDLVVFSGDLAYAAQPEEFALARRKLLDPLQDALGLDRDRMILVPGNHDVDISRIDRFQENGLRDELKSRDAVNQLLDDTGLLTYLDRLRPWLDFHDDYYAGTSVRRLSPLVTLHQVTVGGAKVAVACLTSAWRATGAGDDGDRANLIVGDRQITLAVEELGDVDLKIAAMHHPLDWLIEFDQRDVRRELAHFDMLCTGHVHVVDPLGIVGARGSLIHSQAGSLYQSRDYPNAYSIIDIDPVHTPGACTVHVRSYFDGRDTFAEGVDVVQGGRQDISLGGGSSRGVPAVSPRGVAATRTASDLAADALLETVRERSLLVGPERWQPGIDELLVPPVLLPVPVDQYLALSEAEEGKVKDEDLTQCLPDFHHFVIVGDEYSGLTSALHWLAYAVYRREAQYAPVVIDFNAVEVGANGVDREVRKQLGVAGIGAGRRDSLPRLVLAVDNVDPRSDKRFRHLLKFMAQHPQNVYFLGSRTSTSHRLREEIGREGLAVRTRYIGLFGRRELRALVRMVRPDESEADVTAMLDLLSRGGLPRTPAMLAAVVSLPGQADWTAGVNSTVILESYLGMLLGRDDTSVDRRFELDFRELQDILSCLTEHLMLSGKDALPRMEAEQFLLDYFQGLGWSEPASTVLDVLIAKRILGQRDGMIYFCQPMIRPLLAAYRMDTSAELKQTVLASPLDNSQVIRHAAALRRNDTVLLRTVHDMFAALRNPLGDGSDDPFAARATREGWNGSQDAEAVIDSFWPAELSAEASVPSPEEHASFTVMMDELKDQADAIRTVVETERLGDWTNRSDFEAFAESLDLVADVLRSSELVRDLELKRQSLRLALNGYGTRAALMAAEWEQRGLRAMFREALGEALDRMEWTEEELDALMDRIGLFSPVLSSYASLSQVLASGKLSKLTGEALAEPDFVAEPGQALMAVLLMRRMGDRDWIRHAAVVVKLHGERRVVSEILRLFTMTSYVQPDLGRDDAAALESLLVDIATQLRELPSGPTRGYVRNQMVQGLRNRRRKALQTNGTQRLEAL